MLPDVFGDRLDAFRKERLAEHDFLTVTAFYNVLERVRELENGCRVPPLSEKQRAEQERRGTVRGLQPDYQVPKLGGRPTQTKADLVASGPAGDKPAWPEDGPDRLRAVADMLRRAAAPLAAESLGKAFAGRNTAKRERRVAEVLDAFVEAGRTRQATGEQVGGRRYFTPR